jgi:hypothetical protein
VETSFLCIWPAQDHMQMSSMAEVQRTAKPHTPRQNPLTISHGKRVGSGIKDRGWNDLGHHYQAFPSPG